MTCRGPGFCWASHGTVTCYSHGCRCADCRVAWRNHSRWQGVDAGPYRLMVQSLHIRGETVKRMAEVAGVDSSTIRKLVHGEQRRLHGTTASKLRRLVLLLPSEVSA